MKAQAHRVSRIGGRSSFLGVGVAAGALVAAIAAGCGTSSGTGFGDFDASSGGHSSSGSNSSSGGSSGGNSSSGGYSSSGGNSSSGGYSSSGGSASGSSGGSYNDGGTYTSDATTGTPDAEAGPGPVNWEAGVPFSVSCGSITPGWSTPSSITVNGLTRKFFVQLPNNTSNMALLFLWHGWNQDTATFGQQIVYDVPSGQWIPFDPNAFPMPLMIVTPVDTGLFVIGTGIGLDWDIQPDNPPIDVAFFEGMMQCIQQQFTIDKSRVYSFGFSAGAVMSNLLSAVYPHTFAATISESGAWLSDQAEWADMTIGAAFFHWDWPALVPADKGNILMTHGGNPNGPIQGDVATIILIQAANAAAVPYLYGNDRTVLECTHGFGHALDADLTQSMYYEYLWAHQLGGGPIAGLPGDFPTTANPIGSTYCVFHPAP